MLTVFRAITDRVRSMFAATAALELESAFLARDAERRAELLRQADRYDTEGLHGIAGHLRQQVENLSSERPLATILPALVHLDAEPAAVAPDDGIKQIAAVPAAPTLSDPKSSDSAPRSKKRR